MLGLMGKIKWMDGESDSLKISKQSHNNNNKNILGDFGNLQNKMDDDCWKSPKIFFQLLATLYKIITNCLVWPRIKKIFWEIFNCHFVIHPFYFELSDHTLRFLLVLFRDAKKK
jgi:hypothetical protein